MERSFSSALILEDNTETSVWLAGIVTSAFGELETAAAASLEQAFAWLSRQDASTTPICLVDIGLPDGSGIDFVRRLVPALPGARAVITTLFDDDDHLLQGMAAGAHGYLLKDQDATELAWRLRRLSECDVPMAPAMARRVMTLFRPHAGYLLVEPSPCVLTDRENGVLGLIGRGLTNSEAAAVLGISPLTVAGHIKSIYSKLDIRSRAEAASAAARRGLL